MFSCNGTCLHHLILMSVLMLGLARSYRITVSSGYRSMRRWMSDDAFERRVYDISDRIRDDSYRFDTTVSDGADKVNLRLVLNSERSYSNLLSYVKELNLVYNKAAFIGATEVKRDDEIKDKVEALVLHFRGFERADSLSLYFTHNSFPLIPCPSAKYLPASERQLSYFERLLSGVSGLRVTDIKCPYKFRNVIVMDLNDPTGSTQGYQLIIISERVNKLLLIDASDKLILATNECPREEESLKSGIGTKFELPDTNKIIPDPNLTFDEFMDNFKSHEHMNLLKAMLTLYEGIDANSIINISNELEINHLTHVSKLDLTSFYHKFINWINDHSYPPKNYDTFTERIYNIFGHEVPVYKHLRLADECQTIIDENVKRLNKLLEQYQDDPQQTDRTEDIKHRLENIAHYHETLKRLHKWTSQNDTEVLEEVKREVTLLGDLVGYKKRKLDKERSNKKFEERKVELPSDKKRKKLLKGILVLKVNDNEDSPLIIAGKNAKQNEIVTHEMGQNDDLWLHAQGCPGGHVLLRRHRNDSYSIQMAADVAAYISKAKDDVNVSICVADIKNVKKYENAQLGAVLVKSFRTINGVPRRGAEIIKTHKISHTD